MSATALERASKLRPLSAIREGWRVRVLVDSGYVWGRVVGRQVLRRGDTTMVRLETITTDRQRVVTIGQPGDNRLAVEPEAAGDQS